MVSYDFPRADTRRHIDVSNLSSVTEAAGMQELSPSSFSQDPMAFGYKDLISPDSLGMPNPVLLNPYMTGK